MIPWYPTPIRLPPRHLGAGAGLGKIPPACAPWS